jgi:cell division protein FtsA
MSLLGIFKFSSKQNILAALDIGSSKICCIIAELKADGTFRVMGVGHQVSLGFRNGFITDLKALENSIIQAVEAAETAAGVSINKLILTFSGAGVHSALVKSGIKLMGGIEDSDLSGVVRSAIAQVDQEKNEILHCFPLEYRVNEASGIKNPMGIYAETLSTTLSLVLIPSANLLNLINCVARCHLDVEEVIASPYAALYALLTEEELEIGTTLIDIGATTTSFVIWRDNQLIAIGDIPIGGFHISNDIAQVLSTNFQTAERIKILHSRAVTSYSDHHKMIDIPVAHHGECEYQDMESVSCFMLNDIVSARVKEIFEKVKEAILHIVKDEMVLKRIVLTGGTAQLMDIVECASKIIGPKIRVAKSHVPEGVVKDNRVIFYSAAIGCLYHYLKRMQSNKSDVIEGQKVSSKFLLWLKSCI